VPKHNIRPSVFSSARGAPIRHWAEASDNIVIKVRESERQRLDLLGSLPTDVRTDDCKMPDYDVDGFQTDAVHIRRRCQNVRRRLSARYRAGRVGRSLLLRRCLVFDLTGNRTQRLRTQETDDEFGSSKFLSNVLRSTDVKTVINNVCQHDDGNSRVSRADAHRQLWQDDAFAS
jgi:hypothetical protein